MSKVQITVDGSKQDVEPGSDGFGLFASKTVVAQRVNGELKDLAYNPQNGDVIEGVEISSEDGLNILRHSTAHVLAQAVQRINPEAKLGIGPPIKDGFYYDFDVVEAFTPEDLKSLEKEMERIIRSGQRFMRRVTNEADAAKELVSEPYKLELIGLKGAELGDGAAEVGAGELTIYDNVDPATGETIWFDLCRGPHLPNTRMIGNAFKLMRSAAAYWRGRQATCVCVCVYVYDVILC
jgi:threonyl-tRNA synthetase